MLHFSKIHLSTFQGVVKHYEAGYKTFNLNSSTRVLGWYPPEIKNFHETKWFCGFHTSPISKKTSWSSRCIFGVKWIVFAFKMALNIANDVPACSISKKWRFVGAISQTKMLLLIVHRYNKYILISYFTLAFFDQWTLSGYGSSFTIPGIPVLERDLDLVKVQPSQKCVTTGNIFTILRFELRFWAIFFQKYNQKSTM